MPDDETNELARIITYQEKLGNYNLAIRKGISFVIITYQEKLGNYNKVCDDVINNLL